MRLLVTKAITSHGKYYAAGDIVEMGDAQARPYRSLFGWTVVEDKPKPKPSPTVGEGEAAKVSKPRKARTKKK